jgi:hypothetical protein
MAWALSTILGRSVRQPGRLSGHPPLAENKMGQEMNQPGPEQTTSVQVRRLIVAVRGRVFRAWIKRDALQHWLRPGY